MSEFEDFEDFDIESNPWEKPATGGWASPLERRVNRPENLVKIIQRRKDFAAQKELEKWHLQNPS